MKNALSQKDDYKPKVTEQLDSLWEKVRDRINDMTDEGPKRDFRGGDKATRIKFIEALDVYDPIKSGTVPFK